MRREKSSRRAVRLAARVAKNAMAAAPIRATGSAGSEYLETECGDERGLPSGGKGGAGEAALGIDIDAQTQSDDEREINQRETRKVASSHGFRTGSQLLDGLHIDGMLWVQFCLFQRSRRT